MRDEPTIRSRILATILLAIASIGVSQLPYTQSEGNDLCEPDCTHQYIIPCTPGKTCGFTATTIILYWDGFPLYWFAEIGLIIILIRYSGELKHELRSPHKEEAEEIPVASRTR